MHKVAEYRSTLHVSWQNANILKGYEYFCRALCITLKLWNGNKLKRICAALSFVGSKHPKETDLHTGEITTMSPGKPATAWALVNIHILEVYVHTNDPPVSKKKNRSAEGRGRDKVWEQRERKCKLVHGNQRGVELKDTWKWESLTTLRQ